MSYSYSYKTNSAGGSAMPRGGLSDDAEFQAAKMQAMMGTPLGGNNTGNSSYSYKSTNSSASPHSSTVLGPRSSLGMDTEMNRMKREMEGSLKPNLDSGCGSSTYSHSSKSSNSGGISPRAIYVQQEPATNTSGGSTVKKVITTTTTKTNPHAAREFESLERDFSRIGRTPDDYHDDFDSLKREITSGEAYRGGTVSHEPVSIRLREENLHSTPSFSGAPLDRGGLSESKTTTTTRTFGSGQPMTEETVIKTSTNGSHSKPLSQNQYGEVLIPVKTYDNTFDDLHMNRWLDHKDHFGSIAAPELNMHRTDWENRLRGKKTDMFKFSPHTDLGSGSIESSRTVSKNPLGKPEFSVQFDMRDFKADDINLTTKHGKLIISATHEDKIGNSTSRREFTRSVDLPADIQINMMRSVFSRDGILSITAPIKPPHYDPSPRQLSPPPLNALGSGQPFTSLGQSKFMTSPLDSLSSSTMSTYHEPRASQSYRGLNNQVSLTDDSNESLDFTLPVSGFLPEEISVSVEGRKVKVHGKHVENRIGGRKTHNEFTKMFDLPSNIGAENVRSYIKDGHTLHIIAHLGDNLQGAVHFLAVNRKW